MIFDKKFKEIEERLKNLEKTGLKVGDRVVAVRPCSSQVNVGDTGTIKVVASKVEFYGVEWDKYCGGHSLAGIGKDGHCWWEKEGNVDYLKDDEIKNDIKLIMEYLGIEKKTIPSKPEETKLVKVKKNK